MPCLSGVSRVTFRNSHASTKMTLLPIVMEICMEMEKMSLNKKLNSLLLCQFPPQRGQVVYCISIIPLSQLMSQNRNSSNSAFLALTTRHTAKNQAIGLKIFQHISFQQLHESADFVQASREHPKAVDDSSFRLLKSW